MNSRQILLSCWTWNPAILLLSLAAYATYIATFRNSGRHFYFAAGISVVLLALVSPINCLADGYLFSAHMLQHMLLLLIAPALFILSLPRSVHLPALPSRLPLPVISWLAGVGSMWLWHAPALCDSAATSKPVFALQTVSLLAFGTLFWWQVIAPSDEDRLSPLVAILYLFTACTACTALGIILTFSPVSVCSAYMHPSDKLALLHTIRDNWGISQANDQQIGGLLMWVPMCLIYVGAICGQLVRWFNPVQPANAFVATGKEL